MASKGIKISIATALNNAGINATRSQISQLAKSLKASTGDAASGIRRHMADIKAGFDIAIGAMRMAWRGLTAGLRLSFKFETQTTQFKTLIGDIDTAKRHMEDLKALGDTPPFGIDQFAAASRALMVMTDGVLGYKQSLELVGDAAAATGIPIETMGQMVGRLYAFIRDGQPLSRAVMQLRNMGVITPQVAQKLQDLQSAGASNVEIWRQVESQLLRYKGAMAATEKTGDGLIGAISSRWDNIVRKFGDAFSATAKGGMSEVLGAMKELEEDGSIAVWANRTVSTLTEVKDGAIAVGKAISWLYERSGLSDAVSSVKGFAQGVATQVTRTAVGIAEGEGVWDALKAGKQEGSRKVAEGALDGYWMRKAASSGLLGENGQKWEAYKRSLEEEQRIEEEAIRSRAKAKAELEKPIDAKIKPPAPVDVVVNPPAPVEVTADLAAAEKSIEDILNSVPEKVTVKVEAKSETSAASERFANEPDTRRNPRDFYEAENITADLAAAEKKRKAAEAAEFEKKRKEEVLEFECQHERDMAKWREKMILDEIEKRRKAEEDAIKKRKDEERKALEEMADELRKLHDARMRHLDQEERKLRDQIATLESVNAGNPMERLRNKQIDQAGEERARRQRIKDNIRQIDAEEKLRRKMEAKGATLDDPSKLGRLSNLERATLDRMRLDRDRRRAENIQKERDEINKKMATDIDAINKKLQNLGL